MFSAFEYAVCGNSKCCENISNFHWPHPLIANPHKSFYQLFV